MTGSQLLAETDIASESECGDPKASDRHVVHETDSASISKWPHSGIIPAHFELPVTP
jgi:hypothetical protein